MKHVNTVLKLNTSVLLHFHFKMGFLNRNDLHPDQYSGTVSEIFSVHTEQNITKEEQQWMNGNTRHYLNGRPA